MCATSHEYRLRIYFPSLDCLLWSRGCGSRIAYCKFSLHVWEISLMWNERRLRRKINIMRKGLNRLMLFEQWFLNYCPILTILAMTNTNSRVVCSQTWCELELHFHHFYSYFCHFIYISNASWAIWTTFDPVLTIVGHCPLVGLKKDIWQSLQNALAL